MFLSAFKKKFVNKLLKVTKAATAEKAFRYNEVKNIACVVSFSDVENINDFHQLSEKLALPNAKLHLAAFVSKKQKGKEYPEYCFFKSDIGYKGKLKSSFLQQFSNTEYDLLVNYFDDAVVPLLLTSVQTKAYLRVGFDHVDYDFNDLIVKSTPQNFDEFTAEISNYIKMIKN